MDKKDALIILRKFAEKLWIPNDKYEQAEYDNLLNPLLNRAKSLFNQVEQAGYERGRQLTEEEQRKANSGRLLYQDGYKDGRIAEAKTCAEAQRHDYKKARQQGAEEFAKKLRELVTEDHLCDWNSPHNYADSKQTPEDLVEWFNAELDTLLSQYQNHDGGGR